jgi:hypothetical protein
VEYKYFPCLFQDDLHAILVADTVHHVAVVVVVVVVVVAVGPAVRKNHLLKFQYLPPKLAQHAPPH